MCVCEWVSMVSTEPTESWCGDFYRRHSTSAVRTGSCSSGWRRSLPQSLLRSCSTTWCSWSVGMMVFFPSAVLRSCSTTRCFWSSSDTVLWQQLLKLVVTLLVFLALVKEIGSWVMRAWLRQGGQYVRLFLVLFLSHHESSRRLTRLGPIGMPSMVF